MIKIQNSAIMTINGETFWKMSKPIEKVAAKKNAVTTITIRKLFAHVKLKESRDDGQEVLSF